VTLRFDRPVTLVGGGPVTARQLARALALAPEAVAADGGGDLPLPAGQRFRAVIGDMDSLKGSAALAAAGTALRAIAEQETTDLEKCLLLLGRRDLCFLAPPVLDLPLRRGTRLSLFPLRPVRGTSEGLQWPIDGIGFAPGARIGTSNVALGPVRLSFEEPGMLLILPAAELATAVGALQRQPAAGRCP
jgi:thiamine pyrophosphokinase